MRDKVCQILDLCRDRCLDPMDVLANVLTNYMSSDEAEDFCEREYCDWLDEEDD